MIKPSRAIGKQVRQPSRLPRRHEPEGAVSGAPRRMRGVMSRILTRDAGSSAGWKKEFLLLQIASGVTDEKGLCDESEI